MPKIATGLPTLEPKGSTLPELAKELKKASALAKKFEAQMDQQKSLVHKLTVFKIPPLMENIESDFVNVPGVGLLELGIEVYPSIKKDDTPAFHAFLRENQHGDIIVPCIHFKTLQAFVAEQLANGETFPDYVNIAKIPTAKLKKEKAPKKKR